jgi:prepilin-type N-terminal cleavage/methylation domain-containing protein
MDLRTKGFTLIELLVAVAIFVILITLAVPAFTRSVQGSKADTEMGDLQRAINFARLEAIDRGTTRACARPLAATSGPVSYRSTTVLAIRPMCCGLFPR